MFHSLFRRLVGVHGLSILLIGTAQGLVLVHKFVPAERKGDALAIIALTVSVGLMLAVVTSVWLARRINRPLGELREAMDRIGEEGTHVVAQQDDTLNRLVKAFNHRNDMLVRQLSQLGEEREQLRTILSGMVEGVIALDAAQRVLFVNERAAQLLNLSQQGAVGKPLWEVVRHRSLLDMVDRALQHGAAQQERIAWPGGMVPSYLNKPESKDLTVHAARLPGPLPRGAILVLHDTTELRRLERIRQDFVANVSHELKTPLSVIKANVETLLDGAVEDAEHRGSFLRRIANQADRLNALIQDLLSLARIESGEELFEFAPLQVEALVQGCLERHGTVARSRKQTLEILPGPDPTLTVLADEEAVNEILDNLLDNALKYTPEGGRIQIRWCREGEKARIEVSDTGIGIPEADLPHIFERFYRVDRARSRQLGGTGLGLSIVKHLVQAMRGTIHAVSTSSEGSTFVVTLPLHQNAER